MVFVSSSSTPSNFTVGIPDEKLRSQSISEGESLIGQIEAELYCSDVYSQVIVNLQKLLGESADQAQVLCQLVARETIRLALHKFIHRSQQVEDYQPEFDMVQDSNHYQKLVEYLPSVELQLNVGNQNQIHSQQNSSLSKIANQKQVEVLGQIGQKLQQARESQNISLTELCYSTYVPISHIESIEQGNLESLPDDVFVRSFIKMIGNALGLDGHNLAASFPADDKTQPFLKSDEQTSKTPSHQSKLQVSPIHLYMGYATLVASAIGGLSFIYGQPTPNTDIYSNSQQETLRDRITPSSTLFVSESSRNHQGTRKSGIQSHSNVGVNVGINIAPPERLQ